MLTKSHLEYSIARMHVSMANKGLYDRREAFREIGKARRNLLKDIRETERKLGREHRV